MKRWLKWGLIGGLATSVIGLVVAFTINHALEPSHLVLRPFTLHIITIFSPYSLCEKTTTCVWMVARTYAIILEFILGFIIGSVLSFIKRSQK